MESPWTFTSLTSPESPARLTPDREIDWTSGAQALDSHLSKIDTYAPLTGSPLAVIGLFRRAGSLLEAWAGANGAKIVEPPPIAALFDGTAKPWPQIHADNDAVFVIPHLERCFFRHYHGLQWVRQLIESAWNKPNRLLIGCDAWSWTYLEQAVQVDALCADPITASPLLALASDSKVDIEPFGPDQRNHVFVLHTLLVHDGVPAAVLPRLLPFQTTQILKTLADLRGRHLVHEVGGAWRVTLSYYPAVRRQLAAAGFWISKH